MIAHTGIPVSDYKGSKAFYKKALAPLGYKNNMEYGEAGGFNDGKNTDFWATRDGSAPCNMPLPSASARIKGSVQL